MGERELFLAALELDDPRARARYLDQVCSGDAALRARVEALLKSHEEAGTFLDEPAAFNVDATVAETRPIDTLASTLGDTSATGSGRSAEPTLDRSEATLAHMTGPVALDKATGVWAPDANSPTQTEDGHAPSGVLPRGTTIRYFGDYQLQRELGRGGMGVVYKARQVSLNRPVALKMIKAGVLADAADLQRFQNEAEAVALLDHPGIVPVYEVGDHDGQRYFSMKLVEGGNLAEKLASFKDDPKAAATLLAEAAEAVHHAHMRGILHRDLKPANILVDTKGHPHVTDFGLAKRVEADIEMTASGAILGTPAYMSPEQAAGHRGTITTATDVYGLGAILYALLTSKAPFGCDSVIETLDAVRNQPPEPPTKFNASIPRDLETICLKCLEKDPRRRYGSAQAMADDLRAWLGLRPISARRVSGVERAWLWCQRKPAIAALAAAVFVAIIGGTTAVIAVQARANGVLRDKNNELTIANNQITKANAELSAAKERVKQRFDLADEAIRLYHGEVGDDLVLKADQFKPLRDKLLKGAADFYIKLEGLLSGQPDRVSRVMMGNAYFELGALTEKIGDNTAALATHRKGLAVRRELASEPSAEARDDEVKSLFVIAWLLSQTGQSAEALAHFEEARDLLESLPQTGPGTDGRQALLGRVFRGIGAVLAETGKPAAARLACERSVEILTRLVDDNPAVTDFRYRLAESHNQIGWLQSNTGRPAEGLESYQRALTIQQKLVDDNPAVTNFRNQLAGSHNSIGWLQSNTGHLAEGLESFQRALTILQKLVDDNPAVTDFQNQLAQSHGQIGWQQLDTGRPAEALESFRRGKTIQQKLVDDNPAVTNFRVQLAPSHGQIGSVQSNTGHSAEALESYRRALTILQELVDDNPSVTDFRNQLARGHLSIGILRSDMGQPAEAMAEQEQARAIYQELAAINPTVPEYRRGITKCLNNIGNFLTKANRTSEAVVVYEQARTILDALMKEAPTVTDYPNGLAITLSGLGRAHLRAGDRAAAVTDLRRAIALRQGQATLSLEARYNLACNHAVIASWAAEPGSGLSPAEGRAAADRAMAVLKAVIAEGYRDQKMSTDSDLDALRNRKDFQLLILDLAFPTDPFAR
jgi:eukaryotic-like serine/threonine-protein kinase